MYVTGKKNVQTSYMVDWMIPVTLDLTPNITLK